MAPNHSHNRRAPQPGRNGLVLAEAAVVYVLEREDAARARGARILGEVAGHGSAAEGNNPVVLERDGNAIGRAISNAIDDAGLTVEDIDCAHCHGVALMNYDRCETQGYKKALGDLLNRRRPSWFDDKSF